MLALFLLVVFLLALLGAVVTVPAISRVAVNRRLLDFPDGDRRCHAKPVPRLGGVAVLAGLLLALAAAAILGRLFGPSQEWPEAGALHLAGAVGILFAIGLTDDLRGVPPILKLAGQTAAALLVIQSGFVVSSISLQPGHPLSLGLFALPVTVVWLVGVSNAFNLVDGLDGLAGGVGVIALAAITACALALGATRVPLYATALGGALVGFLFFNRPPARIFLGDSGSLVVGFLLAFLSVKGATRQDGSTLVLLPLFVLSYPLLDTGIAIMRRWLRGDPLSRADGRHIHHQLLSLGLGPFRAICAIYLEATCVAALGLLVMFAEPAATLLIASIGGAILTFILVYGLRLLQYHEFSDAGMIVLSGAARVRRAIRNTISARDVANLVERARSTAEIEDILRANAEKLGYAGITLAGGSPDESWRNISAWRFQYPLLTESGEPIVDVTGAPLMLTLWCETGTTIRSTSVERVAQILGPSIEGRIAADAVEVEARYEPPVLANQLRSV